ncbi:MAG: hypothetical protein RL291_1242 [Pseudomonadota bacterium]|jgi:TRAP-type mannitol/chloroaromatic compound transport system substrate-binding protein
MAKHTIPAQNGQPALDRRDFLKAGSVAAGAVAVGGGSAAAGAASASLPASADAGLAAPAVNAGLRQLTLAVPGAIGEAAAGTEAFRLARRLEDALGDGLAIAVTQTSSGIADGLATAEFDLVLGTTFALGALDPAFKVFAGLPHGVDLEPVAHISWLVAGGGQSLWDDLAASHGLKPLLAGWMGPGPALLATAADAGLRGRRVSAHGLVADVVRAAGAEVVSLRDVDLEQAFQSRAIDAAQPLAAPLTTLAAYSVNPGLMPNGAFSALTVRASFWSKLDRRERAVFEGIASEALQVSAAEHLTRARMAQAAQQVRAEPTALIMGAPDRERLAHLAAAALDAVAQSSPDAGRIVSSHRAWRDLMTGGGMPAGGAGVV